MSLTGISEAEKKLQDFIPGAVEKATEELFNRIDNSVRLAAEQLNVLLTTHENALASFLGGFEITISFKRKNDQ